MKIEGYYHEKGNEIKEWYVLELRRVEMESIRRALEHYSAKKEIPFSERAFVCDLATEMFRCEPKEIKEEQ